MGDARQTAPLNRVLLLAGALLLASCGGGGIGLVGDGGIRGTGSSVGPVSGYGSVVVNGVRFNTDDASITINGVAGQNDRDLALGMLVQVDGEWQPDGEGVADLLVYDDTLRGPVTAVIQPWDPLTRTGRIRVMGLEVLLDAQTRTDFDALADIGAGDFVRISGWLRDDGVYRASFAGNLNATGNLSDVEVEGVIGNLQAGLAQFSIGNLRVKYTGADFVGVNESQLAGESRVLDIEGAYLEDSVGPYIQATNIRPALLSQLADDDRDLQLAGVATRSFTGTGRVGSFELNGFLVETRADTEFDDLVPADIRPGLLLQVEGRLESGVIFADEVELREADAEVQGVPESSSFNEVQGTFAVGGVTVRVGPFTRIELDDDGRELTADDLFGSTRYHNRSFEVEGIERLREGVLDALYIEVDDASDSGFELQGRVSEVAPDGGFITVLGVTLEVDGNTELEGAATLSDLENQRVEVEYYLAAPGRYIAEEIEREDD